MNGIYSTQFLNKIQRLKKPFQQIATWVFIGSIILSAILILFSGDSERIMLSNVDKTLLIIFLLLVISSNNFNQIEKQQKSIQIFATVSLIGSILCAILWILAIWQVFQLDGSVAHKCYVYADNLNSNSDSLCHSWVVTPLGCMTYLISTISVFSFLSSNIMSIKEYNSKNIVKPLKITAIACLVYESLYLCLSIITSTSVEMDGIIDTKYQFLACFVGLVWLIVVIIALIFSKYAKRKMEKTGDVAEVKTTTTTEHDLDAKMRTEIEARVRAEFYEKEIREKVQAEYDMLKKQDQDNQN